MNTESKLSEASKKAISSLGELPRLTPTTGALLGIINAVETLMKDFAALYGEATGDNPHKCDWSPLASAIDEMWCRFGTAMEKSHTALSPTGFFAPERE